MDTISVTLISVLVPLAILLAATWLRKRHERRVMTYKHRAGQNVMAMSRILLLTLETQVIRSHKEVQFLRDERFSVDHDRGVAHAAVSLFTNWYNLAVAPAIQMSSVFEDIMVTKVDRQDTDDGTWLLIHLGQGNDVVKHFLPDYGLQSFITGIRAISSYMQIGVDTANQ